MEHQRFVARHITFRPIAGGKFRCNQTGDTVGRLRIKQLRKKLSHVGKPPPPKTSSNPPQYPKINLKIVYGYYGFGGDTDYICPFCSYSNYKRGRYAGPVICQECSGEFTVQL